MFDTNALRRLIHDTAHAVLLPALLLAAPVLMAQPGTVQSHQKISDTEGGFTGTLDDQDYFGGSVAGVGDLDGDGTQDIAVGANQDADGGTDRGAAWVLFLNTDGTVKSHQKISSTEGGFTGTLDDDDRFGWSLAGVGDLDGDGTQDIAVGALQDDDGGMDRGAVWVLFLNTDGTVKSHQKISSTEGGFSGTLDDFDNFGASLEGLGDLDGDGTQDIAVGAYLDDDGGAGRGAVWVLFMNTDGTVKSHQKISDTEGGFTGTLDDFDRFGASVAGLGDLDGDGTEDIAVGAYLDDDGGMDRGAVWVLFLNADGTVKSHQKISSTEGGFTGTLDDDDNFGASVAGVGDLDGDGTEDIAIGASRDDDEGTNRGAVWVSLLNTDGTVKSHQKISDTEGGFTGTLNDIDNFGASVAVLGDLDGDGIQDIAVGAVFDDDGGANHGAVWMLFLDGIPVPVELTAFTATTDGADVHLAWQTASETNNAGFEVQMLADSQAEYRAIAFVEGHGTTTEDQHYAHTLADLNPGTHRFRLKQIDFDGAFEYSHEVEVVIGVPGTHVLEAAYPNPFNPEASFRFAAYAQQSVRADLIDALGRVVATLFEGEVPAGEMQTVRIDGAGLPSGTYAVRLTGETFSDALTVTLLK